ncbi:MAG: hypothetical protein AAGE59_07910 [Cyanobacteria bacterium P01_F01_bin.86]
MKTNYAGHDQAYQRKRTDPAYAGWIKHNEFIGRDRPRFLQSAHRVLKPAGVLTINTNV